MTNFDIQNAYLGLDQVDKVYLGTDVVWQQDTPEPEPYIDPDFFEPLTFIVREAGNNLSWIFSGQTTSTASLAKSIIIERGGYGSLQFEQILPGGLINHSRGDVISLYGSQSYEIEEAAYGYYTGKTFCGTANRNCGPIMSPFHYFAATQAPQLQVYGNIKSLLVEPERWRYWRDTIENEPDRIMEVKAEIDAIPMNSWAFAGLFLRKNWDYSFEDSTSVEPRYRHLVLPEQLSPYCFAYMFAEQNSNPHAYEITLPAKTLEEGCYYRMITYNTGSTYSPRSGRTLCTAVTCLATDISASACTTDWLRSVLTSGRFIKDPNMTDWTIGNDGVPQNWTIEDYVEPNTYI